MTAKKVVQSRVDDGEELGHDECSHVVGRKAPALCSSNSFLPDQLRGQDKRHGAEPNGIEAHEDDDSKG